MVMSLQYQLAICDLNEIINHANRYIVLYNIDEMTHNLTLNCYRTL